MQEAPTKSRQQWIAAQKEREQVRAAIAVPALAPTAGVEARRKRVKEAIARAAQKLQEEHKVADVKREKRKEELSVQAAVEYMKALAPKRKPKDMPPIPAFQKACRCHLTKAPGYHKDNCTYSYHNLCAALRFRDVKRAALARQLERTTLTLAEKRRVLDEFYGPEASSASSGAASSSGCVGLPKMSEPCGRPCGGLAAALRRLAAASRWPTGQIDPDGPKQADR